MNDILSLLKGEINKTLDDLHDFAKWKLIVISTLAAIGLGLQGAGVQKTTEWLLIFIPYVCAYIDLNCYQYLLRILLIAKFLRESHDDELLKGYEALCEKYRERGFFGLGLFAQAGCSMAFSVILPGFGIIQFIIGKVEMWKLMSVLVIWLLGLYVLVLCYQDFKKRLALLKF